MEPLSVTTIRHALASADGDALDALIVLHERDARAGVVQAVTVARRRLDRDRREEARLVDICILERELVARGCTVVAGVDEVGRGALAGPVTAAAVVLPPDFAPRGLTDSKQLDPAARQGFDALIRASAIAVSVAHVPAAEIDAIGIVAATAEAMRRAVHGLGLVVDHVVVDGLPVELGVPSTAVVKGDAKVRSVAAASIVAKVARDTLMIDLATRFTPYGFEGNKGYGAPGHLAALDAHGPCEIHRRSFAPCVQSSLF